VAQLNPAVHESHAAPSPLIENTLLIVDDDKPFSTRLARAMEGRGFEVRVAETVADGLAAIEAGPPAYAVIDMRLGDGSGLDVIARLKERRPEARGVILTGYGNIATAVTAVKMGAFDYLAKPADADEIHAALKAEPASGRFRPRTRCRPTGCAGSTSSGSTSSAAATSRDGPPPQHAPPHAQRILAKRAPR
jgi:two-component system response regulator RegA